MHAPATVRRWECQGFAALSASVASIQCALRSPIARTGQPRKPSTQGSYEGAAKQEDDAIDHAHAFDRCLGNGRGHQTVHGAARKREGGRACPSRPAERGESNAKKNDAKRQDEAAVHVPHTPRGNMSLRTHVRGASKP